MIRSCLVLCVTGFALAASGPAQVPTLPAAGARVRVVAQGAGALAEGTLIRLSGDTAVLGDSHRQQPFALTGERHLEVLVGRHRATGSGVLYGGAIGFAIGAVLGAASGSDCRGELLCFGPVGGAAVGGAMLGLTGAFAGMVLGTLGTTEVWEPVPATGSRVTVSRPPAGGWDLGAAIPF